VTLASRRRVRGELLDADETGRIIRRRLRTQRLTGAGFARPEDAVGWLGAVQAQDYGPAKWAAGMRLRRPSDAAVERAFAEGRILRTHVLRPTWHFVLPADIRWMLAATAPRDKALAELARRYFTSHGPATAKDFATWASLTLAEVRASVETAGDELRREEMGGVAFWSAAEESRRAPALASPAVHLLQGYDEYVMGYTETKRVLARPGTAWAPATPPVFGLMILLDGRAAGFWKRTVKKDAVVVEAALFEPLDAAQTRALEDEAARYGEFLGLAATVVLAPAASAGP
jgi:hypothetical protein